MMALLTLCFAGPVFSGLTKTGTTAAQFLKIPVGARALGMGGAFVAVANDVTAVYWNPAGATKIQPRGGVCLMHTNWLADLNFDFAAACVQLGGFGTLGAHFTSLSMPDTKVRTEFEPEGTGEYYSAMDMALGLTYARDLTDRFSFGFNVKYLRQQIWHMAASAVAVDLGFLYRTDFPWLTLGISVSNFGPKIQYAGKDVFVNYDFNPNEWGDNENIFANLQTDRWELPLLFRFGLSARAIESPWQRLLLCVEARHPNDNTENISLGMEYAFRDRFFLRAGYQSLFEDQSEKGLTLGAGLLYYLAPGLPLRFDYAFEDCGRLSTVNRFSFELHF
ncbi:MAG: PorV/PorQ family protein [candidate division KSB1 bacterium]|nr:PorV/PorQ family protein [candidate division KSB1 bacterium]